MVAAPRPYFVGLDFNVAAIEPIQSFLSLYIDYCIIKETELNTESGWGDIMMRLLAFFVVHTGIHIPTLHEMCRVTLNPHTGTGTSNLNVQVVFVSSRFMKLITIPCCFGTPLGDVRL